MIFLVTGGINTGKTSYMDSLYGKIGEGDGFICPKVFEKSGFLRYDIRRLSSGKTKPFACSVEAIPENWNEKCRFGKYSFSSEGLEFAGQIVDELIEKKIEPFLIDEVGPLEIEDHAGLYSLVKKVVDSGLSGFIAVRKPMVTKFIDTFQTGEAQFVSIGIK